MPKWKANRDLFTDKDGMQVEAGDPEAAFLLAREGRELTENQMEVHKVKKTRPKAEAKETVEEVPEEKPPKAKAKKKGEDKAVKSSEDKSV